LELWSLFDFVFPGKLGTLPTFHEAFCVPIQRGGQANASSLQVRVAYKCAVSLRDMINPFLLRRLKRDVLKQLPRREEKILLCPLTNEQRELYKVFLQGKEVRLVQEGKINVLFCIDVLRKICNHPELVLHPFEVKEGTESVAKLFANTLKDSALSQNKPSFERSGKIAVLQKILPLWRDQGHRTALFSQTRQMLNILESFLTSEGLTYFRLDGNTPVALRSQLVREFNANNSISVFLLTTRVGGIGLNIIGADRVVIFDPDWNPSTDLQAEERSWRVGQTKDVAVYRLFTQGTIEEKIYQRQIFKQFLSNKILVDPTQKRFFKRAMLNDLFTLDMPKKKPAVLNYRTEPDFYEGATTENGDGENAASDSLMDDEVLKSLFGEKAVNSIISHAKMFESCDEKKKAELLAIDFEADKLVKEASLALERIPTISSKSDGYTARFVTKESKVDLRNNNDNNNTFGNENNSSLPTFGSSSRSQCGFSSASLFAQIEQTKKQDVSAVSSYLSELERKALVPKDKRQAIADLTEKICEFLRKRLNHSATTRLLLRSFKCEKDEIGSDYFIKILKQLALFDSSSSSWELKDNFL
jgi:DNA excision repair protein ERCC-6